MLENDVKDKQGKFEGVYTFQGFRNGMDFWVDVDGEYAIWHYTDEVNHGCRWRFGTLEQLGHHGHGLYSEKKLEKQCPNNEGYIWNWIYRDGSNILISTNDVYIKCANEDDFCTSQNPCGTDEGDCDTHDECLDGLFCGSNNCLDSLGLHSEFDCCYPPNVGDEYFCTLNNPCSEDEGDCDSNNECQTNLICDITNSCPTYLGFASEVNCCFNISMSGCKSFVISIFKKCLLLLSSLT